ncbi:toll-like receptor 7 [Pleurodeles waltl]|uniref:toll-like receptor 7 n=1 Tax=Pleurodeles waltl TaxID=8319 RepID=UPI003709941D
MIPSIKSQNVTTLDLNSNHLELIANYSLSGIPNLISLNLSWNCAPGKVRAEGETCKLTIEHNAFNGLCNLQSLSLAGNSLTVVPWLPSSLKLLDLEMNNIVTLGLQNISGIVNLRKLYLGMNCYYRNPCNSSFTFLKDMFKDAKSLSILSLRFNNLTSVPLGLPPTLLHLDLSENQIAEIKNSDFNSLTKLEHLNLQWNCQRCDHSSQPCFPCANNSALRIHPDAFHHLKNLRKLKLRGNSLRKINDSLFVSLTSLRSLDVSDNFLAYDIVNGTFFSMLSTVTQLCMNYNYVPGMFFPKLTLSPSFADMHSLKYLFLDGYFFGHLDEKGIEPLLMLSDLQIITFRTNFIDQVNLTLFAKAPSLKLIDLSRNILTLANLCERSQGFTENVPPSLSQEMTLSEYYPHWSYSTGGRGTLPHHTYYFDFPSCENFNRTLDLSFNNIRRIEPEFF